MKPELLIILLILPLSGGIIEATTRSKGLSLSTILAVSLIISISLLVSDNLVGFQLEWLPGLPIIFYLDNSSSILIVLVTGISLLVSVFSIKYMEGENTGRYFGKLGLFVFAMLGLVLADQLVTLLIFWELVGLASYLLIGYWYRKDGIPQSARTAFMVNRVADVALLSGILLLVASLGSVPISGLDHEIPFLPSLLIMIGAFGKSAQFPFSGWLTKAMVGPTPVSALIHAATMVAAGVYVLFRLAPMMPQSVLNTMALIGAITTLYGAVSAITQHDIKKVLAYSTISQLGYMIIGIGVGAGEASMFHLWTHAFFKAGLFLGAGAVIHCMKEVSPNSDPQDLRAMGGLQKLLPWTFSTFLICGMALSGIPFLSGFLSKEGIILAAWSWAEQNGIWGYLVSDIALFSGLLTAFYIGRLILLTFLGSPRERNSEVSGAESWLIKTPLALLALGSLWIFYSWNPLGHDSWLMNYFGLSSEADPVIQQVAPMISIALSVVGLSLAYIFFKPGSSFSEAFNKQDSPVSFTGRVVFNGFYLTDFYRVFGNSVFRFSEAINWIERSIIDKTINGLAVLGVVLAKALSIFDRLVVDGIVNLAAWVSKQMGRLLSGVHAREAQLQIVWLLLFLIMILSWTLL